MLIGYRISSNIPRGLFISGVHTNRCRGLNKGVVYLIH